MLPLLLSAYKGPHTVFKNKSWELLSPPATAAPQLRALKTWSSENGEDNTGSLQLFAAPEFCQVPDIWEWSRSGVGGINGIAALTAGIFGIL